MGSLAPRDIVCGRSERPDVQDTSAPEAHAYRVAWARESTAEHSTGLRWSCGAEIRLRYGAPGNCRVCYLRY